MSDKTFSIVTEKQDAAPMIRGMHQFYFMLGVSAAVFAFSVFATFFADLSPEQIRLMYVVDGLLFFGVAMFFVFKVPAVVAPRPGDIVELSIGRKAMVKAVDFEIKAHPTVELEYIDNPPS